MRSRGPRSGTGTSWAALHKKPDRDANTATDVVALELRFYQFAALEHDNRMILLELVVQSFVRNPRFTHVLQLIEVIKEVRARTGC